MRKPSGADRGARRAEDIRQPDRELELERLRERAEQLSHLVEHLTQGDRGGRAPVVRPPTIRAEWKPMDEAARWGAPFEDGWWWPASPLPLHALTPPAGHHAQTIAGATVPTLAVRVFGLRGEALERMVAMVATRQRVARDFRPVFLTDSADLAPFRRYGFACEHFPPALYGRPHDRAPRFAVRARLFQLQRKWSFSATLELSARADESRVEPKALARPRLHAAPAVKDPGAQAALIRESGLFDEAWYQGTYPDAAGQDPVEHYLSTGAALGYDPSPMFRSTYYIRQLIRRRARRPG